MKASMRRAVSVLLGCGALLSLCAPAAGADVDRRSRALVGKLNALRAGHGLPALRHSRRLSRSSRRFGRRLMRSDRFGHASRIRAGGRFSSLGEVLALHGGWRIRPRRPIRMWLRSSGHRRLILSRGYTHVGGSPVRGRFDGRLSTIWVVQLGGR